MNGHTTNAKPDELIIPLNIAFTIWFVHDKERGGYQVGCHGLPEVAGYGETLKEAKDHLWDEIKQALNRRSEIGKRLPKLTYAPPWRIGGI